MVRRLLSRVPPPKPTHAVVYAEPTVSTAVLVLRTLIASPTFPSSTSRKAVITRLASSLHSSNRIQDANARATVYWLVGQHAQEGMLEGCGADTVRLGAKGFASEVRLSSFLFSQFCLPSSLPFGCHSRRERLLTANLSSTQSSAAKLQLLTLSAKLLVLAHQSPLTPHLRPLSLLFDYLALLARYDLDYEVRDRARFLAGLVGSAGIGQSKEREDEAKVMLQEEEFKRGVMVEDLTGGGEKVGEKEGGDMQRLTGEQVKRVLFEGKQFGQETGALSSFSFPRRIQH
jgi:AP-3 complex subunit beta